MRVPSKGDPTGAVLPVAGAGEAREVETEVLVVGGGTGGVASAWAAGGAGEACVSPRRPTGSEAS